MGSKALCLALVAVLLIVCGLADARPAPARRLTQDPTAPFFGSLGSIFGGSGGGGSPGGAKPAASCIPFAPLCPPLYRSPACCARTGDGPADCGPYSGSCPAGKSAFCCS